MAEIYRRVNGKKTEKFLAQLDGVQATLQETADNRAAEARSLLDGRADHRTHTSFIEVERGRVDRYVVLNDERGLLAAWSIEFGRRSGRGGGAHGLFVLTDAFGLDR